jgi:hypothetical protein
MCLEHTQVSTEVTGVTVLTFTVSLEKLCTLGLHTEVDKRVMLFEGNFY